MVTYRVFRCKSCSDVAQQSRRAGTYKVLETKRFLILKCSKCSNTIKFRRKYFNGDPSTPNDLK